MVHTKRTRMGALGMTAFLCTGVISAAYWFGSFDTLQAQLTDRFFVVKPVPSDILIVDIDEESIAALGQWPWDRSTHATLLSNIGSAKVVAFDVIFTEPSRLSSRDDEVFAEAILSFEGKVVLPQIIDEQSGRVSDPIEILDRVTLSGFVNTKTERDGVVREADITRGGLLSFDAIVAGDEAAAASPATIRVFYHGPATTFTTLSYIDVHEGRIPNSLFKDKTVLIGASAAGLGDTFQTPFGTMPGVEIHANTITTLRAGTFLTPLARGEGVVSFAIIALFILLSITYIKTARNLYAFLGFIFFGIIFVAYLGFSYEILVPHVYQIILFILVSGTLLLLQFVFEIKEKQFIRRGFEQYVATEVVEELQKNPDKLTLGGETRMLTILFSDIRGFTTISEQLTPQELMEQLNEYLEEMSEAVMQKQGLVDKYIGDAVMAFWGAPLLDEKQAEHAARSVLAMTEALTALNKKWKAEGRPEFKIGVGISTGEVVVGNMGSKRRFNYSIIGDEVNFSARLEGLTKAYGVECIIGEQTYKAIAGVDDLFVRELDDVMVKGKNKPRKIYELLTTTPSPEYTKALDYFREGRAHYQKGEWDEAITAFEAAVAHGDTGPGAVFLKRSQFLKENPPQNWSGVFTFTEK